MKKVIVLDFGSGEVHVYSYRAKKGKGITKFYKEVEDFLREETDHHLSDCQWMVLEEDAKIIIH